MAEPFGPNLLRAKGIVRIRGEDRPLAVHGVQHTFHPPTRLARWPAGLKHPTLVLILADADMEQVYDAAREFGLMPTLSEKMREIDHAL